MFKFNKWWACLLGICWAWSTAAQPWEAADLKADLDALVAELEREPWLQAFQAAEQLPQRLATTKAMLNGQVSAQEWFRALHYLLAGVGEGHVQIGTPSDDWYTGFGQGRFRSFPLTVRYRQGRLYVWNNYSDQPQWQRGDELYTINGWTIDSLRQHFHNHSLSDGAVTSSRDQGWQNEFSARYYWLVGQPDNFVVTYRSMGDTALQTQTLPALTMLQMAKWAQQRNQIPQRPKGLDALYNLQIESNYALLRLRNFDLARWKAYDQTPASFYQNLFQRLRRNGVRHLILDLRDNKGGARNFVDEFLPYLRLKPSKMPYQQYHKAEQPVKLYQLPKRHPLHFRGKLFVLINGKTYSSAALLAQYAVQYAQAQCIGEEAGSRIAGFAGGTKRLVTLPHSGTVITLPTAWITHEVWPDSSSDPQRGLMPDQLVTPSIQDALEQRDPVLEKALEQCR